MAFADAVALTPIAMSEKAAVSIATLASADGTNGNKFFANHKTLFRVVNGSGSSITVTVNSNRNVEGLAVADDTFAVAASGDVMYSGFSDLFHQNSTGEVHVEYSAVTTVTVQVIQL